MARAQATIKLVPDGIHIVSHRRDDAVQCLRIELPREADDWLDTVRGLTDRLQPVVESMGLLGARTRVIYRSPTASVDLSSFPMSAGAAQQAAVLALTGGLPYPVRAAVTSTMVVGRDRSGGREQGEPRRHHVIVAADRNDVAMAIGGLVDSIGLKLVSSTPIDAPIMYQLARSVLRHRQGCHGHLYIGEEGAFLAVSRDGRLEFGRPLGMARNALVRALERPLRGERGVVELSRDEALDVLYAKGIPDDETVVDADRGLRGSVVRPLLMPVLSRCMVEVRQSLRFGLGSEAEERPAFTLSGPGAAIPGLCDVLGDEIKADVTVCDACDGFAPDDALHPEQELIRAMAHHAVLERVSLLPRHVQNERSVGRIRRGLWIGAAAGLGLVIFDGWRMQQQLASAESKTEHVRREMDSLAALEQTSTQLFSALAAVNDVEARIAREIGYVNPLGPLLKDLAQLTPESIRFARISLDRRDDGLHGSLRGMVPELDGVDPYESVAAFVQLLDASPLLRDVTLMNVERGSMNGEPARQFDVAFTPILLPRSAVASVEEASSE